MKRSDIDLEKEEIRKIYDYELVYKSNVFSRKKQKEEIAKLIDKDEHLFWLKEKGFKEISDIIRVYDQRLDEAEENDFFREYPFTPSVTPRPYTTYWDDLLDDDIPW